MDTSRPASGKMPHDIDIEGTASFLLKAEDSAPARLVEV